MICLWSVRKLIGFHTQRDTTRLSNQSSTAHYGEICWPSDANFVNVYIWNRKWLILVVQRGRERESIERKRDDTSISSCVRISGLGGLYGRKGGKARRWVETGGRGVDLRVLADPSGSPSNAHAPL